MPKQILFAIFISIRTGYSAVLICADHAKGALCWAESCSAAKAEKHRGFLRSPWGALAFDEHGVCRPLARASWCWLLPPLLSPTYLPTYLPTHLPTYLPIYSYLATYLPTSLPTDPVFSLTYI